VTYDCTGISQVRVALWGGMASREPIGNRLKRPIPTLLIAEVVTPPRVDVTRTLYSMRCSGSKSSHPGMFAMNMFNSPAPPSVIVVWANAGVENSTGLRTRKHS